MLRQRVITAVVLLALLLPALFARALWPFALLSLAMVSPLGAQSITVAAGSSPTAVVLPGAKLVVPVVVELEKQSLKVRDADGYLRSYNGPILRKLYGKAGG